MGILKSVLVFIFHKVIRYHKTRDRKNPKEDMDNIQREYARYKRNPELMIESEKEILFSWIYNSQDITAQEGVFFDKHQVPNIMVSKYLNAKFFFEEFDSETFKLRSMFLSNKTTKCFFIFERVFLLFTLFAGWIYLYSEFISEIHTLIIIDIGKTVFFIAIAPLIFLILILTERQIGKRDMADDFLEYIKNLN